MLPKQSVRIKCSTSKHWALAALVKFGAQMVTSADGLGSPASANMLLSCSGIQSAYIMMHALNKSLCKMVTSRCNEQKMPRHHGKA